MGTILDLLFGFLPARVQLACLGLVLLILGSIAAAVWLNG